MTHCTKDPKYVKVFDYQLIEEGKRKRPDLNLIDRRIGFAVSAVAIDLPNKLHQL